MTNAVVPDGLEVDDRPARMPGGGGLLAGIVVVALAAIVLASGGVDPVPADPEETLPPIWDLGDSWNRLDLPGSAPLTAVATLGAGRGYVAAGDGPQFWWSDDGLAWRLGGSPAGPRHVAGIAQVRDTVVAVGADTDTDGSSRPALWYLDADEHWMLAESPVGGHSALEGVEEAVGRVVAWGWKDSPRDFDPATDALALTSTDGVTWTEVSLPQGMRVRGVRFYGATWYFLGSRDGRPAVFGSDDLEHVEEVATDGLPFGWTVTDLSIGRGPTVANLVDLGVERTRQWRLGDEGEWVPHAPQVLEGPVVLEGDAGGFVGVGSGRLWTGETAWMDSGLDGQVGAVAGNVAVGSHEGQPAVWVRGVTGEPSIVVVDAEAGWEPVADLGNGVARGPWLVAGRWVVGVGSDWWSVAGGEVTAVSDLSGLSITRIDRVGEEWVALPAMLWTSDGTDWEQRDEPWPSGDTGYVEVAAVTETAEATLAVGLDDLRSWVVAATTDGGRSWRVVNDPAPRTPIDLVRPVPGGFTAVAALPRNKDEIVSSPDGENWEALIDGEMVPLAEPPAVVTPDGRLVMLDTNEERPSPADGVTAVIRGHDDRLTVVAGGSLWIEPPTGTVASSGWVELSLDPAHGVSAADVRPLPSAEGTFVLAVDRGHVQILRWRPAS